MTSVGRDAREAPRRQLGPCQLSGTCLPTSPQTPRPKAAARPDIRVGTRRGGAALAEEPCCPLPSEFWGVHAGQCGSPCKVRGVCWEQAALQGIYSRQQGWSCPGTVPVLSQHSSSPGTVPVLSQHSS